MIVFRKSWKKCLGLSEAGTNTNTKTGFILPTTIANPNNQKEAMTQVK